MLNLHFRTDNFLLKDTGEFFTAKQIFKEMEKRFYSREEMEKQVELFAKRKHYGAKNFQFADFFENEIEIKQKHVFKTKNAPIKHSIHYKELEK